MVAAKRTVLNSCDRAVDMARYTNPPCRNRARRRRLGLHLVPSSTLSRSSPRAPAKNSWTNEVYLVRDALESWVRALESPRGVDDGVRPCSSFDARAWGGVAGYRPRSVLQAKVSV